MYLPIVVAPEIISNRNLGAIGVDINADHLAVSQVDARGNWVSSQKLDLSVYGKNTEQSKALIGDVVKQVMALANQNNKPIAIESLDFAKKKAELSKYNPRHTRMLSSFAYNKIINTIKAVAFRAGVEIIQVNPAYTSTIGAVNWAQQYGVSVHQAAAIAIARRTLGFSERLTSRNGLVPVRGGSHVTFLLPVRNHKRHVWRHWSGVRKNLLAAHVAHIRCGDHKKSPPPLLR